MLLLNLKEPSSSTAGQRVRTALLPAPSPSSFFAADAHGFSLLAPALPFPPISLSQRAGVSSDHFRFHAWDFEHSPAEEIPDALRREEPEVEQ